MQTGPQEHRRISALIAELAHAGAGDRIRMGDIVAALGDRAFALLILIFALPNAIGLGGIPGLSTIFGVPQIFIAIQMAMGRERPWLPRWVLDKSLARGDFVKMTERAAPYMARAERVLRPRWPAMCTPAVERFLGVVFAVLAAIVSLPIVFGNQPPAIAMAVISLGIIERDGLYIAIGLILSVIATLIAVAVVAGFAAGAVLLVRHFIGI